MQPKAQSSPIDFTALKGLDYPSSTLGIIASGIVLSPFLVIPIAALIVAESVLWWFLYIAVLGLVVYGFVHWVRKNRQAVLEFDAKMTQFATTNNFAYLGGSGVAVGPGTLFTIGSEQSSRGTFAGQVHSLPFQLYAYQYVTGSGKSRTTHDAMVMQITLPRVLPQFVIDSEIEDVLPISFDKSQKIELEGDFHKYFDLYAPDKYGISALTLLAPDVMEVLLEHAALCDVEIVKDTLYFYWSTPSVTAEQFEQVFTTTTAVIEKLGSKLTKDNIFATATQQQVNAEPNAQGVRLKKSGLSMLLVLGVLAYVATEVFGQYVQGVTGIFMVIFWVGFVGYMFFTQSKKAKLKKEYFARYRTK